MLSKTSSPQKLFDYDIVTLYMNIINNPVYYNDTIVLYTSIITLFILNQVRKPLVLPQYPIVLVKNFKIRKFSSKPFARGLLVVNC